MSPRQFQREGESLPEIAARAVDEFGPSARIVAADRVTVRGIRGLFGRSYYEVTVEVPDRDEYTTSGIDIGAAPQAGHRWPDRGGIAALLDAADDEEAGFVEPSRLVPTTSSRFDELLEGFRREIIAEAPAAPTLEIAARELPPRAAPRGPLPLAGVGDLVLVLGQRGTAAAMATTLAEACPGAQQRPLGDLGDATTTSIDRRGALALRAAAVRDGQPIYASYDLDSGDEGRLAELVGLDADQVWIVVDASRKHDDTRTWVEAVQRHLPVDALAVVDVQGTASPETVLQLGVPLAWVDGEFRATLPREPRPVRGHRR